MIKRITFILSLILVCSGLASDQNSGFGLGIIIGEPTGISAKLWQSQTTAYDAGIAWTLGKNGHMHLHADHLWHSFGLINVSKGKLPVYYGIGARFVFADDLVIGARFVGGLDYMFATAPIDIFLELAPVLNFVPGTDFEMNGAIGFRYFF
ncbi:MAG: hypothetical protein E4H13_06160 [Calditrichales bacterium]|nr:MAG: hypothetical protein E4H13_06160 [Calditrichales bacterium]